VNEPLESLAEEVTRLRRCLNDLASLVALPDVTTNSEPAAIGSVLDALTWRVRLAFAFVRLTDREGGSSSEIARVAESLAPTTLARQIGEVLDGSLGHDSEKWPATGRVSIRDAILSIATVRLGFRGELGVLVAGFHQSDSPSQSERLVLAVAANRAAIALEKVRQLSEQRMVNRVEELIALRTADLAAANAALTEELAERRRTEELRASELRNAFDEIRKSEAKLRRVIDTIPTLAWCNLPDGPNEFLNKGWHEYTGLPPDESHGWGWQVAFHPDDLPPLMERWGALLVSGESGEIEARLRRHDGVYRWFLIRVEPYHDETGNLVRWYGTSTDIDDRKRVEEQLRRSEAFLAEGQRLSRTSTFLWRVETNEITWSEEIYRILAIDTGVPVTLEHIAARIHPDDHALFDDMIERAHRGVSDFDFEHRLLMPDHSVKHLHLIAHGTRDQQKRLEYLGAVQDVTQRRASEEALARARSEHAHVARAMSLGVLTASIAHEVNQPLAGIVTNASTCLRMLVADPPDVEGARETARRTIRDGNRAAEVIARLRALFSRKTSILESVDLNDVIRDVIASSLSRLQDARVLLRLDLVHNLPSVTGDRVQLQQVILNLIGNAADAMRTVDDRPRQLAIHTLCGENDWVHVTMQDSGVGFDPRDVEKLFDPFYTTKQDGMGIGLSLCRSIVEGHRGRLWATPNEGYGATFSFSIPAGQRTSPEGQQ
jgi:PAS domain S-box-containing protein